MAHGTKQSVRVCVALPVCQSLVLSLAVILIAIFQIINSNRECPDWVAFLPSLRPLPQFFAHLPCVTGDERVHGFWLRGPPQCVKIGGNSCVRHGLFYFIPLVALPIEFTSVWIFVKLTICGENFT